MQQMRQITRKESLSIASQLRRRAKKPWRHVHDWRCCKMAVRLLAGGDDLARVDQGLVAGDGEAADTGEDGAVPAGSTEHAQSHALS